MYHIYYVYQNVDINSKTLSCAWMSERNEVTLRKRSTGCHKLVRNLFPTPKRLFIIFRTWGVEPVTNLSRRLYPSMQLWALSNQRSTWNLYDNNNDRTQTQTRVAIRRERHFTDCTEIHSNPHTVCIRN